MKHFALFLILIPMLTACPSGMETKDQALKKFRKETYNILPLKKFVYGKIRFKLPKTMQREYSSYYTYKSTAASFREYNLGVIFSVERFTNADLYSEIMRDFEPISDSLVDNNLLNGFHDAYVDRRYKSLYEGNISFKKDVRKNVKFPGTIQVLSGTSYEYGEILYYVTACLQVENEYYIFQWICTKEMMQYVYDDFERLLASVRKK